MTLFLEDGNYVYIPSVVQCISTGTFTLVTKTTFHGGKFWKIAENNKCVTNGTK